MLRLAHFLEEVSSRGPGNLIRNLLRIQNRNVQGKNCKDTLRQLFRFLLTCFFTAVAWKVVCDLQDESLFDQEFGRKGSWDSMVLYLYFTASTISLTGIGDAHPVSSAERVCGVFLSLFGISFAVYFIGNLNRQTSNLQYDRKLLNEHELQISRQTQIPPYFDKLSPDTQMSIVRQVLFPSFFKEFKGLVSVLSPQLTKYNQLLPAKHAVPDNSSLLSLVCLLEVGR